MSSEMYSAATMPHIKQQTSEVSHFHDKGNLHEISPIILCPLALCSGLKYYSAPYSMTSTNQGSDCPSLHRSLWRSRMPSIRSLHRSHAFLRSLFQRENDFSRKLAPKAFSLLISISQT